jgi:TolB-like protein/Tfp pilus assembly protein PilF
MEHPVPDAARGKIIQLPRIRPSMPGITESQAASRASASRIREIRAYVAELLTRPAFVASGRRGQLLQYLVQRTLAGDAGKVNEYAIGLEVFDRPASFDPRIESVVRTEFSRLRQRLKDYYAEEGRRDRIVIDFPPRSYAATFTFRDVTALPAAQLVPAKPKPRLSAWVPALAVVMAIGALAGFALWKRHANRVAAQQPIHTIVVLPFENYSPNHQDEYLADGMTEELTNDLAQLRDLRVVARTSAFAFQGKGEDVRKIGRQLNVDAVLEGSFTKEGDQVRITAQLNRTADGYHLWSHAYETESKDLLAVQEDVANSIADQIRRMQGGGPAPAIRAATTNPEAHDLYLQGMYQFYLRTPDSMLRAVQLFDQALAADPSFARAWLGIGSAEIGLTSMTAVTPAQSLPRIRQAAQKAIGLDPTLGDAYGLQADVAYMWDWNWSQAEVGFRRALDLGAGPDTRARYGWSLATRGQFDEAHEQLHLAAEQDPLSLVPPFDEFFAWDFQHNVAGEKRDLARLLEIRPDFLGAHAMTVVMAVEEKDCKTAQAEADYLERNYPTVPSTPATLAFAAACRGDRAEALRRIGQMEKLQAPAYQLAIAWALLHDADRAIAELSKSADAHEGQILYLRYDPFFDRIRSDPRYVALEKRVGLLE